MSHFFCTICISLPPLPMTIEGDLLSNLLTLTQLPPSWKECKAYEYLCCCLQASKQLWRETTMPSMLIFRSDKMPSKSITPPTSQHQLVAQGTTSDDASTSFFLLLVLWNTDGSSKQYAYRSKVRYRRRPQILRRSFPLPHKAILPVND